MGDNRLRVIFSMLDWRRARVPRIVSDGGRTPPGVQWFATARLKPGSPWSNWCKPAKNPPASGRGRRCVSNYGRKTYDNCSRTSKAACDGRQADPNLSLQSHSRAGSALHCLVGQAIEPKAPGGVPQANLQTTHCLVGQAIEPKAPGGVPQANLQTTHCLVGQAIEPKAPGGVPQANLRSTTTTSRAIAHQCNRMPARKALSIGCWNVRTLLDRNSSERPERRTALVAMELARYHIDIAALSETRLAEQGKLHEAGAGYTFYWVGNAASAPREHGVGFAISDRLNGQLVGEPTGISARLMTVRLRLGRGKFATFISTYGPTMCYPDDTRDQFYTELSSVIRSVPRSDRLFLLGDFNARVGRDASAWTDVIGAHGIGSANANGDRLLSLCATHGLTITNTRFALSASDIATWTHPRSGHAHLLDYVIVRQRDMREVRMTRVLRGAECGTDHKLVRTKLYIYFRKSMYCTPAVNRRKFNILSLGTVAKRTELEKAMAARLCGDVDCIATVGDLWHHIRDQVTAAAEETIGRANCKRPDWFDDNNVTIDALVSEKNAAFAAHVADPSDLGKSSQFRKLRRRLTRELRRIKNAWWTEKAKQMECYAERRQHKEFFDSLKAVYGPRLEPLRTLIDGSSGATCTQTADIMQVWRKHFDCLLNNRSEIDWPTLNGLKQHDVKADLADTPRLDETQRALAQLRNGKCAGGDGIPPEVLKHGGPALLTALHHLVQRVWIEEEVPSELKDALVLPLYKGKGSKQCCTNYRGINLLSCVGKVIARILLNRLVSQIVEPNVAEEQCGFRSGRSTIDMVFAARQLQEKCRERHQPLYSLFVDFTKAFDTVNREALWLVLGKFGCPRKFVSLIECLHSGMRARVQLSGETSDDFTVVSGVKQGCVLAPALFNIYLHAMLSCAFDAACAYGVRVEHRIDGGLLNIRRFGARTLV
ncbi:unnamed protein product, partial [Dicrocoelium dendriticum]